MFARPRPYPEDVYERAGEYFGKFIPANRSKSMALLESRTNETRSRIKLNLASSNREYILLERKTSMINNNTCSINSLDIIKYIESEFEFLFLF